ncbi:class III alcohol dehydrogenase [Hyphomonas polymorpha PS728]|uniref:Class III alcohol dehydrogenase n=1 Tax=Hyphomonas polymorpha PS728 TaxID=1280954 RepID=A0A062VKX8_9PROT|nr:MULTISPECIES: Zn-dependent alcohol dehydrogenase [Hyphomonas]AXE66135.1 alcohol dehydrogenase [Hyphomonas sp. CACIAM 19H1]KCZ98761.1 class III alcohol dehydrogenase [Hyphomonas polymorpha PS728]
MKAAVMRAPKAPLSIEDVTISKPGPREVLVRLKAIGVCHSDVHFWDGAFPAELPVILGHESAGVVEQVGSMVTAVKPGDHVISILSPFCGTCEYCLTGHMSVCHTVNRELFQRSVTEHPRLSIGKEKVGQFLNLSSFAEQILVHENTLCAIDKDMPMDRACLIGCGVITGVGSVFHSAQVEPGSTVAVIGCGGVGLAAINGAAIAGASRIIAVDLSDQKLQLATRFGATDVVNPSKVNAIEAVKELTKGGVHYSFECVGAKQTAEMAYHMLRPRGVATVIGMIQPGVNIEIPGIELLVTEKRIQGAVMGSNRFRVDFPRLIDLYKQGKLHLDDLISDRIGLEGITGAMQNLLDNKGSVARQVVVLN